MQGACHILDSSRIIISVGHFECIITDTHNALHNLKFFFLSLNMDVTANTYTVFLYDLTFKGIKVVSCIFLRSLHNNGYLNTIIS